MINKEIKIMTVNHERKKKRKFIKKVEKVAKNLLRVFCLFLFFHWSFFTEVEEKDTGYSWVILEKDPLKFFLIKPFENFAFGLSNKGFLRYLSFFLKIFSKALVFKLISNYISYSFSQPTVTQRELANLSDPYLSEEERKKAEKKFIFSITGPLINFFLSLPFYIALFFHGSVLKKNEDLFPNELKNYQLLSLNIFFDLLFGISREFVRQRWMLTKKEMKKFLAKNLPLSLGKNLFYLFLAPYFFRVHYKNFGDVLIMVSSMLIDFLINAVKSLADKKISKKDNGADWRVKGAGW